jgi:hypothetical protein
MMIKKNSDFVGIPLAGILTLGTRKGCPYKIRRSFRIK